MNKSRQTKEQLINQLIGLVQGTISVDDLKPKDLCICIGYGTDNVYLINNKASSKEQFDEVMATQPPEAFTVSYEEQGK